MIIWELFFRFCLLQQGLVPDNIKREVIRIKKTPSSLQGFVQWSAQVSNITKEN